ncbi:MULTISPECIES: methyltransferase domain-containing protein [unclassified Micromonospora]|uniref:class I SAM-dependent methyltransferase n=1 Tax=unclassified Micromonospora TaxID=2617518 RepID=UPI0022B6B697|nr:MULTISPECIES: methyltransferase domain-containing protein [unclassified Micromonospora]MCZ7423282.1 methyltransferase domain-containing protein [Verrucosispora sp. WMMA2121]WBB90969.1 methyltransferase domain-containing protein [Verrucosispora sp. WMMC514]
MTGPSHHTDAQQYLPGMGRHWLLPLYDPFSRLAGIGRIHGQLMDRANLRSGQRILEIGCGTGNLLTALGRRVPDIDALGIDPDPAALRRARRKAARHGLPIRYEQAFAGALPLPDDSVDRVLSAFMLHHLDDDERARALREAGRVLRSGGELHVLDIDGTPSGRGGGMAHRNARVAASLPERVLASLVDAGLAGVAGNGGGKAWFGRFACYRAEAP